MAQRWGSLRRPSVRTLLIVLHGLEEHLDGEVLPEQLLPVLQASQRAVLALAAPQSQLQAAEPASVPVSAAAAPAVAPKGAASPAMAPVPGATAPTWPPLCAELAEAAIELLLACFTAAAQLPGNCPERAECTSLAQGALLEGTLAVLSSLAACRQPLTSQLCCLLLRAFEVLPAVEMRAQHKFGPRVKKTLAAHSSSPHDDCHMPVLRMRRGFQETEQGALPGGSMNTSEGRAQGHGAPLCALCVVALLAKAIARAGHAACWDRHGAFIGSFACLLRAGSVPHELTLAFMSWMHIWACPAIMPLQAAWQRRGRLSLRALLRRFHLKLRPAGSSGS